MNTLLTDRPIKNDIIAVELLVSRLFLEDATFDSAAYIARECERAAAEYIKDDELLYTYCYLLPVEYGYEPGPFAYRFVPGDIPDDAAVVFGRVRVKEKDV